jgi:hypothetical protein
MVAGAIVFHETLDQATMASVSRSLRVGKRLAMAAALT